MPAFETPVQVLTHIDFGPNIAPDTDPSVSPSGVARLFYDTSLGKVRLSLNGGAFSDVATDAVLIAESQQVYTREIDPGAAGGDIAARTFFVAPAAGCTITKIGIVPLESAAGIDNANTCVVAITDGAANSIVSKTYNTATQPPAAGVYESLGTISATHGVLTANETVLLAVTQGATSDVGILLFVVEWAPTA